MKKTRLCRIDRNGCVFCGGQTFEQHAVINDQLASSWGLSVGERRDFDEREGHACKTCQMSKRVRMLLWSVRRRFSPSSNVRILHFNQINNLTAGLRALGDVTETCYQPGLEHGAKVGDCVNEDICNLTFPNDYFDLAVHSETLEHLFDFKRGLLEVERVLKPGGVQIYTLPLLHNRSTRQRMRPAEDGTVLNLLPPSYHGNEGEFPVIWEFGSDFFERRQSKIVELHYDNYWRNKSVFSVIEKKVSD